MRDEIDGRIWTDHHDRFSDLVDRGVITLRSSLRRLAVWDGTSQHLLALLASFALTALTFTTTTTA